MILTAQQKRQRLEYFSGIAMQGILSNKNVEFTPDVYVSGQIQPTVYDYEIARESVASAKALIEELDKDQK